MVWILHGGLFPSRVPLGSGLSCLTSLSVTWRRRQCTLQFGVAAEGQGFHSEKPEQAGRMGQQQICEIQQGQMQSPVPGMD